MAGLESNSMAQPLAGGSSPRGGDSESLLAQAAAASTEGKAVSLAAAPVVITSMAPQAAAASASSQQALPPPLPVPGFAAGNVPSRPSFSASSAAADVAQGKYQTLDEPVRETIMRDVRSIAEKITYVMMPKVRDERAERLKDWDLWGPLLLCLALGLMLAWQAPDDDQASYAFADVFCIVWAGSGIVTLNALLLRGKVSFFQSVCVLGYCMCPLVIAAFLAMLLGSTWFKVLAVGCGTFWSTVSSVGFVGELVPDDRTALAVYPVGLFYVAIAWMIILA